MVLFPKFNIKSISVRIILLIRGLIISTITFYIFFSIPSQKAYLIERMRLEAKDVASAYIEANRSALITDAFQLIIDYSIATVKSSNSVQYIAVYKLDGTQSFIFQKKGWSSEELKGIWATPGYLTEGGIIKSEITNTEIYHLSKKFIYTGIEWGWIHVGLSTESYNKAINEMITRQFCLLLPLSFYHLSQPFYSQKNLQNQFRIWL